MAPSIPFLITARLSSVRLPKKLLRELDGTELVSKVIERGINAFGAEHVILCTSPLASDDELVTVSERHGISVHRGDPVDILLRLAGACRERNAIGFVGQTGENPIFEIDHCLRLRDEIAQGRDLVRYSGLPIGCSPYGISRAALETLLETKQEEDTGFWGYLLNRPEIFDVLFVEADPELYLPVQRLTVDYLEDLDLMKAIHTLLPGLPELASVIELLKTRAELRSINAMRVQGDLDPETKNRLDLFFKDNTPLIKERLSFWRKRFK